MMEIYNNKNKLNGSVLINVYFLCAFMCLAIYISYIYAHVTYHTVFKVEVIPYRFDFNGGSIDYMNRFNFNNRSISGDINFNNWPINADMYSDNSVRLNLPNYDMAFSSLTN
jgi:hypothetical protein